MSSLYAFAIELIKSYLPQHICGYCGQWKPDTSEYACNCNLFILDIARSWHDEIYNLSLDCNSCTYGVKNTHCTCYRTRQLVHRIELINSGWMFPDDDE